MDLEKTLKDSFLFGGLGREELRGLAQVCSQRKFKAGELIFSAGDQGDALFVVQKGGVRVFRVGGSGAEQTIAVLGPGGVFGEVSFLTGARRSTGAAATQPCLVAEISRFDFDIILTAQPAVACQALRQLVLMMASRTRAAAGRLGEASAWMREMERLARATPGSIREAYVEVFLGGGGKVTGRIVGSEEVQEGQRLLLEDAGGQKLWLGPGEILFLRMAREEIQQRGDSAVIFDEGGGDE